MRQQRNYGALNETRRELDEQQAAPNPSQEERAESPRVLRTWTHEGGMVQHHDFANKWVRQNHEIKMAANDKPGAGREGEGAQSSQPDRAQQQAELQEARAAAQDARQREAAERSRQQERDRGGPER